MQDFSKRTKTRSTPLISGSCSPMRNSLCVVASVRVQLPVWSQERVSRGFFRAGTVEGWAVICHRAHCCLERCWGLPSWPALPLDHLCCVPKAVRPPAPSRQTLARQKIVGAGWSWKNSFLAESKFSSKCQGGGGVKMIHKFKHIF